MIRVFFLFTLIVIGSCNNKQKPPAYSVNEKITLMQTDEAFSNLSVEKGMKTAFIEYIDSNGVLLKSNHLPIVGAHAIDYLIEQDDANFTLNWQPHNAFVSLSADLGYTYGVWALHQKNKDTVLYGTYVSIWKKQGDGKWKFVLDSGNQGIGDTLTNF